MSWGGSFVSQAISLYLTCARGIVNCFKAPHATYTQRCGQGIEETVTSNTLNYN